MHFWKKDKKKSSNPSSSRSESAPSRLENNLESTNRPLTDEDRKKHKNAGELLNYKNHHKGEGSARRAKNKLPLNVGQVKKEGSKALYTGTSHGFYNDQGNIDQRVDTKGAAHGGVSTPHVQDYEMRGGRVQRKDKTVRKPTPAEDPLSHTRSSSSSSSSNAHKSDDVVARGRQKDYKKVKENTKKKKKGKK